MADPSQTIRITVNGSPRALDGGISVRELVVELGLDPEMVAVERNREIVRRPRYDEVTLEDGDQLEIVEFVGGG